MPGNPKHNGKQRKEQRGDYEPLVAGTELAAEEEEDSDEGAAEEEAAEDERPDLLLREGDAVTAGQTICTLETDDLRDRVKQTEQRIAVLKTQIRDNQDNRLEEHLLVGRAPGILEHATLVGGVHQVPVDRVRLLERGRDVEQHVVAAPAQSKSF